MANKIYLSDLMKNGAVVNRPAEQGMTLEVAGAVRIPSGTTLATTDKILLARLEEGVVFDQIMIEFPDLDSDGSPTLTLDVGYDRPVVDPGLAYNASTNPYTDNAIATADTDFFEAAATTGQAGGVLNLSASGFTVTTSPAASGDVDVSITPAAAATGATAADLTINFIIRAVAFDQFVTPATESYNYTTNYDV